jgi:hypothetical protein
MTTPIDARTKLKCAERELRMRRKVYPRWVAENQLSQEVADRQIAVMAAIVEDYRKLAEQDEPRLPL